MWMKIGKTGGWTRRILIGIVGISLATLLSIVSFWAYSFSLLPELFKLNRKCQEEGYYMAEFEFQMLGLGYYLDKGQYAKATSGIRKLHDRLRSRKGLVKVPRFSDKKEEMAFYLNLQNPRTGAFIDDFYPYCSYEGPTGNVLSLLDTLAKATGEPLRLNYPLKFFDEINTPEKLKVYLDDIAYIGWIASRFPESTFHMVRDLASYATETDIVYKHRLYSFSPEWKRALLTWIYENQDPETGFWGPRPKKNGRLWKLDLHNTGSIVKAFVDGEGNNLHESFPLRYKDRMFSTTLQVMNDPLPDVDRLDQWHGWTLKMFKGVSILTRYLWKDSSRENKAKARIAFETLVKITFDKYYLPGEGAFCYYPGSEHATIDGTGHGIAVLAGIGALSPEKQRRLWGRTKDNCTDLGISNVAVLTEKDFDSLKERQDVNSLRLYADAPDGGVYTAQVAAVYYPKATSVLDMVELMPKIKNWLNTTSQSMGNWISRQETLDELSEIQIEPVPVSRREIPLEQANQVLQKKKTLTVIGFDVLQIPRCKKTYRLP